MNILTVITFAIVAALLVAKIRDYLNPPTEIVKLVVRELVKELKEIERQEATVPAESQFSAARESTQDGFQSWNSLSTKPAAYPNPPKKRLVYCKNCGQPFETKYGQKRHCSSKCRISYSTRRLTARRKRLDSGKRRRGEP